MHSDSRPAGVTTVLFLSHETSVETAAAYAHLRHTAGDGVTVRWLLDVSNGAPLPDEFAHEVTSYDSRQFAEWGMRTMGGAMLPGHCHFPLIRYCQINPVVEWLWAVEYDVRFTGSWSRLFEHCSEDAADLLACHIRNEKQEPDWHWWNTLRAPDGVAIEAGSRTRAFCVAARYSARSLRKIAQLQASGWYGHQEVIIPTLLLREGMAVRDLNDITGPGGRRRKFYTSRNNRGGTLYRLGTVRYRPIRGRAGWRRNMIYHPVKPGKAEPPRVHPGPASTPPQDAPDSL